jgi:large subunit ribosomal protein L13
MDSETLFLDATDQILGRLASYVAKNVLNGKETVVLNVEKAVISGKKKMIVDRAKLRLKTRTLGAQEKGPVHYRRPDMYARRVIRGMLPWKKSHGKVAFKKVKVYMGIPEEFKDKSTMKVPGAEASRLHCSYITLQELAGEIGRATVT